MFHHIHTLYYIIVLYNIWYQIVLLYIFIMHYFWFCMLAVGCHNNNSTVMSKQFAWRPLSLLPILKQALSRTFAPTPWTGWRFLTPPCALPTTDLYVSVQKPNWTRPTKSCQVERKSNLWSKLCRQSCWTLMKASRTAAKQRYPTLWTLSIIWYFIDCGYLIMY